MYTSILFHENLFLFGLTDFVSINEIVLDQIQTPTTTTTIMIMIIIIIIFHPILLLMMIKLFHHFPIWKCMFKSVFDFLINRLSISASLLRNGTNYFAAKITRHSYSSFTLDFSITLTVVNSPSIRLVTPFANLIASKNVCTNDNLPFYL